MRRLFGKVVYLAILSACGGQIQPSEPWTITPISAQEARRTTFPYAFSGQILSVGSDAVLTQFSVDVIGADPAVNSVLNPLGDKRGIFHISRSALKAEVETVVLPVLITAPAHEATVFYLEVKTDCFTLTCPGRPAHTLRLRTSSVLPARAGTSDEAYSAANAERAIRTLGANQLFGQLNQQQKFDSTLQQVLASSKNGDQLTNILVVLNRSGEADRARLVANLLASATPPSGAIDFASILSGVMRSVVPTLASISPEFAAALSVAKSVLPYLKPLLTEIVEKGEGGTLAKILALVLTGQSADRNLTSMGTILASSHRAQLGMGGFLPYAAEIASPAAEASAFGSVLYRSLVHAEAPGISVSHDPAQELIVPYVRNLIQALGGKDGNELRLLFNRLVGRSNPLKALKTFPASQEEAKQFSLLAPHLVTLTDGLNGQYEVPLTHFLMPIINSRNPAESLARTIRDSQSGEGEVGGLLKQIFPGVDKVWSENVSQKQLFAAQLVQGALRGEYQDVVVLKDLEGSPAIIISAQARDLFKIAQLPNVERLVAVNE